MRDDDTEDPFTLRLESAVLDAPAGGTEAERNSALGDAWFPGGDAYECVGISQGPNVDPLFGRSSSGADRATVWNKRRRS